MYLFLLLALVLTIGSDADRQSVAPTKAETFRVRRAPVLTTVYPDIVVFVVDDVADSDVDAVSAKGWTPNLDAMAAQGVRFRRAYSHAKCIPTRDSMNYSRWLGLDRGDTCAPPVAGLTHSPADFSLPELLDGFGYRTLHVGKWHVGTNTVGDWKMTPQVVGYDNTRGMVPVGDACNIAGVQQPRVDDGVYSVVVGDNTIQCRDALLQWWAETPAPRFAVVNFGAAHAPFKYPDGSLLPPGYPPCGINCTNRKEYEAEIVGLDTAVGQVMSVVGPNTYTVFVGDNGTPGVVPGENPNVTVATRPDQDPNKVKLTCYEDGVRVPLIIAGPNVVPGESQALVHVLDLMPTLGVMATITVPPKSAVMQGRSFAGCLIGLPGPRDHVFVWNPPPSLDRALIERQWKLVVSPAGVEELYYLPDDPRETNPLPLSGPDYTRLRAKLDVILAGG